MPKQALYSSYDATAPDGRDVEIFSATGEKRSQAEYETAYNAFAKGEETPGFTVLPVGSLQHWLRSKFQTASTAAGQAAEGVGKLGLLGGAGLTAGLNALGVPSKTAADVVAPQAVMAAKVATPVARSLQESVNTPEKAGLVAGMALATPALAPVSVAGGTGAAALRMGALARNALTTGIFGTAGAEAARGLTGGPSWSPFQLATEFGAATAQGGINGWLTHMANRYIAPALREKVLGDMRDVITKQYPQYATDPSLFDAAASNAQNLEKMAQVGVKGLQESADVVYDRTRAAIQQRAPASLPRTVAHALRGETDTIHQLGTDFLDATGDAQAQKVVMGKMQEAADRVKDMLTTTYNGATTQAQRDSIADMYAATQQHLDQVRRGMEGAVVMKSLREGMTNRGFDVNKFAEAIRGSYLGQGRLMQDVGEAVGAGQMTDVPGSGIAARATNYLLGKLPLVGKMMPTVPAGPAQGVLPWQVVKTGPAMGIGASLSGPAALQSFTGRDITQSSANQPGLTVDRSRLR